MRGRRWWWRWWVDKLAAGGGRPWGRSWEVLFMWVCMRVCVWWWAVQGAGPVWRVAMRVVARAAARGVSQQPAAP